MEYLVTILMGDREMLTGCSACVSQTDTYASLEALCESAGLGRLCVCGGGLLIV